MSSYKSSRDIQKKEGGPDMFINFHFHVHKNLHTNKNIKMSSFKSSKNIQQKEGGPDRSVLDNQSSSVTLNELAMEARKDTVISRFSKEVIH